jgi:hypothetical protein
MSQPTKKNPEIDNLLINAFGVDRKESITNNLCAWCKSPVEKFKDALSVREYRISRLCQKCQDEFFGEEED